jgi:hypothetical protein
MIFDNFINENIWDGARHIEMIADKIARYAKENKTDTVPQNIIMTSIIDFYGKQKEEVYDSIIGKIRDNLRLKNITLDI